LRSWITPMSWARMEAWELVRDWGLGVGDWGLGLLEDTLFTLQRSFGEGSTDPRPW
jgi:hypothetical protein